MPYIKQEDREKFGNLWAGLPKIETPGELNYLITMMCHYYIQDHGEKYQTLNDVSGALTNVNLELYRRVSSPYEDRKIQENGDVY